MQGTPRGRGQGRPRGRRGRWVWRRSGGFEITGHDITDGDHAADDGVDGGEEEEAEDGTADDAEVGMDVLFSHDAHDVVFDFFLRMAGVFDGFFELDVIRIGLKGGVVGLVRVKDFVAVGVLDGGLVNSVARPFVEGGGDRAWRRRRRG